MTLQLIVDWLIEQMKNKVIDQLKNLFQIVLKSMDQYRYECYYWITTIANDLTLD